VKESGASGIEPAVKRNLILAALAGGTLTLGLVAAPGHAPLRLVTASSSHEPPAAMVTLGAPETGGPGPSTTVAPVHHRIEEPAEPATTVPGDAHHGSTTTVPAASHDDPTTTVPHEPATTVRHETPHETPHEPTTSSTTPKPSTAGGPLTIGCTTAGTNADVAVHCIWNGVADATTRLVVMREKPGSSSQAIWRTDDVSIRRYDDETAEAGTTYVYRVSAYGPEEHFLGTSNPVRVTPGAGGGVSNEPQPSPSRIALTCTPTGPHAVHCSWEKGPESTVGYRLIRVLADGRNRVIATNDADHRWADDIDVPTGTQTYYVQVVDASGKVIAGGKTEISCCGAGETSR
jgi:hypothetical protein